MAAVAFREKLVLNPVPIGHPLHLSGAAMAYHRSRVMRIDLSVEMDLNPVLKGHLHAWRGPGVSGASGGALLRPAVHHCGRRGPGAAGGAPWCLAGPWAFDPNPVPIGHRLHWSLADAVFRLLRGSGQNSSGEAVPYLGPIGHPPRLRVAAAAYREKLVPYPVPIGRPPLQSMAAVAYLQSRMKSISSSVMPDLNPVLMVLSPGLIGHFHAGGGGNGRCLCVASAAGLGLCYQTWAALAEGSPLPLPLLGYRREAAYLVTPVSLGTWIVRRHRSLVRPGVSPWASYLSGWRGPGLSGASGGAL